MTNRWALFLKSKLKTFRLILSVFASNKKRKGQVVIFFHQNFNLYFSRQKIIEESKYETINTVDFKLAIFGQNFELAKVLQIQPRPLAYKQLLISPM